jgi:hypothetical protein
MTDISLIDAETLSTVTGGIAMTAEQLRKRESEEMTASLFKAIANSEHHKNGRPPWFTAGTPHAPRQ